MKYRKQQPLSMESASQEEHRYLLYQHKYRGSHHYNIQGVIGKEQFQLFICEIRQRSYMTESQKGNGISDKEHRNTYS